MSPSIRSLSQARFNIAWAVTTASVVGLSTYALNYRLNHDVGWWLYIAESILQGAALYSDLIEINPPLYGYLVMIPAGLSRVLPVDAIALLQASFLAISLSSALWAGRRVGQNDLWGLGTASAVLLFAFPLLGLPGYDWGQREHMMVALTLPYLVVSAMRPTYTVRTSTATVVGACGGLGFCLKPHFVVLWIAIETIRLFQDRSYGAYFRRPEFRTVGAVIIGYAAVIVLFEDRYLHLLHGARDLYGAFAAQPLIAVAATPASLLLGAVFLAMLVLRPRGEPFWPLIRECFVFGLVAWMMALLQGKGWSYHFYPAMAALTIVALLMTLGALRRLEYAGILQISAIIVLSASLVTSVSSTVEADRVANDVRAQRMDTRLRWLDVNNVSSFAMLSHRVSDGFPLVNYARVRWSSPYSTIWWIHSRFDGTAELGDLRSGELDSVESRLRDRLVARLVETPPDVLLIDTLPVGVAADSAFPYVAYLSENPKFDRLWTEYERHGSIDFFRVYRRKNAVYKTGRHDAP